jgi:hypothetical protein
MVRTTRQNLEGTLRRLCDAMGVACAYERGGGYCRISDGPTVQGPCVGEWFLDHDANGWTVSVALPSGGEERPLGHRRRTAGELWEAMVFAFAAVTEARKVWAKEVQAIGVGE